MQQRNNYFINNNFIGPHFVSVIAKIKVALLQTTVHITSVIVDSDKHYQINKFLEYFSRTFAKDLTPYFLMDLKLSDLVFRYADTV